MNNFVYIHKIEGRNCAYFMSTGGFALFLLFKWKELYLRWSIRIHPVENQLTSHSKYVLVNRLRLWITRSEANRVARNWRLMPDVWIAVKNYPQKRFGPMGSMNWHQGSKIWWPVYDGQYAIGLSKYINIMLPSSLLS